MTSRIGVVTFPGTNCEHDVAEAIALQGGQAELLWHGDASLQGVDAVILPGGFAHGDYLRPGALARFSPIMRTLPRFAREGGPIVGICNGFQVLTEAGMLPGALQKNEHLKFLCTPVELEVTSSWSVLTRTISPGTTLSLPINHFAGSYVCDDETLARLEADERVVLRYRKNPNGSVHRIAGVANEGGNVVGLMPHPERAVSDLLGSSDGARMFRSLLSALSQEEPSREVLAGQRGVG